MSERASFMDEAKKQIDNLSAELDGMAEKMVGLTGEAKIKFEEQAGELRGLLKDAELKFDDARKGSEEAWGEVKGQVDLTRRALKNSFNYFLSHYKKK